MHVVFHRLRVFATTVHHLGGVCGGRVGVRLGSRGLVERLLRPLSSCGCTHGTAGRTTPAPSLVPRPRATAAVSRTKNWARQKHTDAVASVLTVGLPPPRALRVAELSHGSGLVCLCRENQGKDTRLGSRRRKRRAGCSSGWSCLVAVRRRRCGHVHQDDSALYRGGSER